MKPGDIGFLVVAAVAVVSCGEANGATTGDVLIEFMSFGDQCYEPRLSELTQMRYRMWCEPSPDGAPNRDTSWMDFDFTKPADIEGTLDVVRTDVSTTTYSLVWEGRVRGVAPGRCALAVNGGHCSFSPTDAVFAIGAGRVAEPYVLPLCNLSFRASSDLTEVERQECADAGAYGF